MTAFSPFDNKDYDNMSLPYAFYEISMANSGDRDAKVSLRFVFPEYVKTWAVASDCTGEKTIRKGGTATARFVVAWYDHTDPELAHYKNLYASPQPIAKHGLEVFSRLKHNAMRLADGMRSSSLPHWLQNQVANTLSAIVINSMYKRDGRVAFAEGQWTCFGTMDQMWLARHIICQAVPFYAWRELEYWARTQMKNGQIHHDMNLMDVGSEREKRSALVAWDDTEHRDYRDIQKWVDLNCGFIISVYEAYRTTGDRESFLRLWPNMKRAADRIKKQVELLGNKEYPLTFDRSENSYDAGGNPDPYNANISAVAYRIMAELSAETGEDDEAAVRIAECDGSVRPGADGLEITGATEVLLLARVEPTRDFSKPAYTAMVASLDSLGGYGLLLERHVARHQPLYDRVKIDLGAPAEDRSLSSEQLLAKGGRSLALIERLFNAARYNVLSATGLHAPCLQGIWGAKMTPNWAGDFTANGNLPVAISHMLQANTPELMLSLFNQLEAHMDDFRTNARVLFNCRGIHIPSHFYTHGLDCQFDKTWPMTFWVAGAPWYSMFYWDYYLYTRDREFLRRRALPFMEEAVAFFEDFLTEGADGKYIVNPSYSPENHPKNYKMQACINATMDIAAIKAMLRAVIEASRTLGANSDRIPAWQAMLDKMPAYGNNADGEFREWLWADMEDNHEHRHASHLIGLYDLHDPEIMQSRELRQGALKAIDRRMDFRRKENTGVMAFGICQLAFSAAALGQADRCEEMLGWLGDNYFLDNMFSTHDPHNIFNCDISGGYLSLVMKMLCYSEPGRIDVFPAKPSSWRRGSIKGMALRGGIIMEELRWDGSKTTVTLRADDTQKVSVTIYGKHVKNVRLKKGKPTTLAM